MSLGQMLVLASFGALFGTHAAQAETVTLQPISVDFPNSDRAFPPGAGVELVTNNCIACHSSGMILTQPALTKATWLGEVNKMRSTYKAPISDEDVDPIATYLASLPVPK